ncbi:MAG: hypothetical protein ABEN55_05760, partial [Bradymonadaceae bacterium]
MSEQTADDNTGDGDKKERPAEAAIGSNFKEKRLGEIGDFEILKRLWTFMRPYRLTFGACLLLLPLV